MNITRYDPFAMLSDDMNRNLLSRFNRLFGELDEEAATSGWTPAVDVREEDDKYLVTADIPGVNPDEIEVTLDNNVLSISGKRDSEKREDKEGYHRVERSYGRFLRRLVLPETVDDAKVSAKSEEGVLYVTIPKSEKQKAKRVKINT